MTTLETHIKTAHFKDGVDLESTSGEITFNLIKRFIKNVIPVHQFVCKCGKTFETEGNLNKHLASIKKDI